MPSPGHTVLGYDFVLSSCILLFACSVSSGAGKKQTLISPQDLEGMSDS